MKWYFCFNHRVAGWFDEMIRVCVTSNARFAGLEPHCLYDGPECGLTGWLREQGVTVHHRQVSFRDELGSAPVLQRNAGTGYDGNAAAGFFLPLEIARVEETDPFVLFTDVDVMFLRAVDLSDTRPHYLAACGEVASVLDAGPTATAASFNSGVLVINVAALRADYSALVDLARSGGFHAGPERAATYDQWLLNAFYAGRWDRLDDSYNWRSFWEPNPDARIVHFHGPKPMQITAFLADGAAEPGLTGVILQTHRTRYLAALGRYDDLRRELGGGG